MKKFFRYCVFHIKSAGVNIARHFSLACSAAFSVCISLILVAVFALLTSNLTYMSKNIESELSIRVSIDQVVDEAGKQNLMDQIRALDGVNNVTYRTRDEELDAYRKEYKSSEALFSMYEGEGNPIPDVFVVEAQNAQKMAVASRAIQRMDGVLRVSDGGTMTEKLLELFDIIRYGGSVAVVVLLLVALFLIANKIKMSIYTRRNEFAIMRFVGAGNWFIRVPMMLEGLLIGLAGALPAAALTIAGYCYLYQDMQGVVMSEMLVLQPTMPLASSIAMMLVICGMSVGLMGSLFSTSRYLKWKR